MVMACPASSSGAVDGLTLDSAVVSKADALPRMMLLGPLAAATPSNPALTKVSGTFSRGIF